MRTRPRLPRCSRRRPARGGAAGARPALPCGIAAPPQGFGPLLPEGRRCGLAGPGGGGGPREAAEGRAGALPRPLGGRWGAEEAVAAGPGAGGEARLGSGVARPGGGARSLGAAALGGDRSVSSDEDGPGDRWRR